ncbi:MAG: FHA domain-containing protein [Anaerolineae bacterium]|nr:FHA domain-containing protein [Anaerolineae bacterium]
MITVKICPTCKHENAEEAAYCVHCGALLVSGRSDTTTRPVSETEILKLAAEASPPPGAKAPPAAASLALFVVGQEQPILLGHEQTIILGRGGSGESGPALLDPQLAVRAGVSRNHASISYADGVYTIKDLGSTNGTWVNNKRLLAQMPYVLQSGDQIRLGALVIYIYFQG